MKAYILQRKGDYDLLIIFLILRFKIQNTTNNMGTIAYVHVYMHIELMLLNCGVGEDFWESLGQQGDPTSQS